MIILILIFILSLVPAVLIYLWLKKRKAEDDDYKKICALALKRGAFLCVALVFLLSSLFYITEKLMVMAGVENVIVEVYHNYITLAFAEELMKYMALRGLIKKNPYSYSWLNITSLMMIIGIGFELSESVAYALGSNAGMMLTRGITAMHCGYGFIMGYFVGKGMKTRQRKYTLFGFIIPFLLHGTYDCCLSDLLAKISGNFAYVSLSLAVVAIITLVFAIIHIRKAANKTEYTEPLVCNDANV